MASISKYRFQVRDKKGETRFSYQDGEGENKKVNQGCGSPKNDACLETYRSYLENLNVPADEIAACVTDAVATLAKYREEKGLPAPVWVAENGNPALDLTADEARPDTSIPAEMRERKQWVAWSRVERNGKTTKPPVDPKTGNYASV